MFTQENTIYTLSPKIHAKDAYGHCFTTHYILAQDVYRRYVEPVELVIQPCEEHKPEEEEPKPIPKAFFFHPA